MFGREISKEICFDLGTFISFSLTTGLPAVPSAISIFIVIAAFSKLVQHDREYVKAFQQGMIAGMIPGIFVKNYCYKTEPKDRPTPLQYFCPK